MKKIYFLFVTFLVNSVCQSLSAQSHFYYQSGNAAVPASWNSNPGGGGTAATTFTTANTIWHLRNASAGIAAVGFNPPATSTVLIESGRSFTVAGNASFAAPIDVQSTGSLVIQKANVFTLGNLNSNSTITFSAGVSFTANITQAISYGNVVVLGNASLTASGTSGGTINGKLTIANSKTLSLNQKLLTINGSIDGTTTGDIAGDNLAGLSFGGGNGGNNGTLRIAAGTATLNSLTLNYGTSSDFISVNQNITIDNGGLIDLTKGYLDLRGRTLHINAGSGYSGPNALGDGGFMGDASTNLLFEGSIGFFGFNNELMMNPANNNIGALMINSSGETLLNSAAVTIHDSLSILDGTFDTGNLVTIPTPAGGPKARVSRIGGNGVIQNNITVQTVISGGSTGWNLLGSPVDGQTIANWDTYATNGGTSGLPMTCNGCFYSPSALTPSFASIQGWITASDAYDDQLTSSTALSSGKGFWVYVGDGSSTTNDMTLINSGPVVQGIQAFGISSSGQGWNLMSNPYASPISWSKVFNETDGLFSGTIDAEVHVFSPDVGYGTYVANTGGTNGMLDILGIGQGFYILANTGAVSLVFDEVVKMDDQSTEIWKTSSAVSNSNREYFKLTISGAYGKDETMINFDNRATPYFDRLHDGHKIFSSAGYQGYGNQYSQYTTLSTRGVDGTDYSVNSLPLRTSSLTVPMLARVMVTGSHTISVSDRVNFESCLILHDKLAGKYHDLNAGPYVFDISDTTSTPRFDLIMCQSESGPVMSVQELQKNEQVFINQDAAGPFVRTSFDQRTKATISAFNIVGQQVMSDVTVDGTETLTRLNLSNMSNQVVIIRVTTDTETTVKKIVTH